MLFRSTLQMTGKRGSRKVTRCTVHTGGEPDQAAVMVPLDRAAGDETRDGGRAHSVGEVEPLEETAVVAGDAEPFIPPDRVRPVTSDVSRRQYTRRRHRSV